MQIVETFVSYHARLEMRPVEAVDTVVIHCTEVPDPAVCRRFAERIVYESETGNCGHFYVWRNGRVEQYVSLERVAHHVRGHNHQSVGIELINRGRYPHWYRSDHQQLDQPYTEAQYDALEALLVHLKQALPQLTTIVGHSDLDTAWVAAADRPTVQVRRKVDPGPLFDWKRINAWWKKVNAR
jgi:N-acetylmuramoyl-L-alanine amidase